MYSKVLIPLDGSSESEKVVSLIEQDLAPDGEIVLLVITPRRPTKQASGRVAAGVQQEEADRGAAIVYLEEVVDRCSSRKVRWQHAVMASDSVAEAVVDKAMREAVDVIAMYSHGRKGIARLLKGNLARDVARMAVMEVRPFTDSDLATYASA